MTEKKCTCTGWRHFGFNCFGEIKCDTCQKPLNKPKAKDRFNSFLTVGMALATSCRNIPQLAKEFEEAMYNISNILKPETMNKKVFKFSEIVPEGFTVDRNHIVDVNFEEETISVHFVKGDTITFSQCIDQYLDRERYIEGSQYNQISQHFKNQQFKLIEFEIKIGLFKFVCLKLKVSWLDVLRDIKMVTEHAQYPEALKVINITGEDFLKSIIND